MPFNRLVAACCLACLAGCATTGKKPPHPDDPLLLSKKPVEGRLESPRLDLLARAEPAVPPLPIELLAAREPSKRPTVSALPTSSKPTPPPTMEADPAPSAAGGVPATPAVRRRADDANRR